MMDFGTANRRLEELFETDDAPSFPRPGTHLAIYGAGNCGRDTLHVLREEGYHVAGFLDANAHPAQTIDGTTCCLPGSQLASELSAAGIPILVAVFNYTADPGEIEDSLHRDGFQTVLPYATLAARFPDQLKSTFWATSRSFFYANRAEILRALALWDDDTSRDIFVQSVELRLTHNLQLLRQPDRENQYFPNSLPPPREPIRAIDGGAYIGDTLKAMLPFRVEAVAAFEPDTKNFGGLRRWVEHEGQSLDNPILFPCGLGAKTEIMRFQQGNAAASCISSHGDSAIQLVALDDVLPRFQPNFIKLDIEGAEIEALIGAASMIRRDQPRIAACVYHCPSHFWEVPLLLRELAPSNRLHLRYHGFNGFDAVAYSIPK